MKTYGKKPRADDDPLPAPKRRRLSPDAGPSLKLTKRMLGRSRTESSIASPSPAAAALTSRTVSMPALPPPPPPPEQERRPAISAPRVKHTYAGQSRSFLVSLPVSDINPDAIPGLDRIDDDLAEPESYSSLRDRWGVGLPEDDIPPASTPRSRSRPNSHNGTPPKKAKGKAKAPTAYLPPNMMNPLKSITELRSKGESRRFLDEVGYLFEGMDPSSSTSLKRSSASEIITKLCDEDFARKAKAADFYPKTWDVFLRAGAGRGEDKVLDILLVFLIALITRNRDDLIELVHQEIPVCPDINTTYSGKGKEKEQPCDNSFIAILFFIFNTSAAVDPLAMSSPSNSSSDMEFKKIGLSKKDKIILSNIYSTISRKSKIFKRDTPITTSLLISHILTFLPPSYIPHRYFPDLLHSLHSCLRSSFSPNKPFKGVYPQVDPAFECIKNHLQLLDVYLLNQWAPEEEDSIHEQMKQNNLDKLRDAGDEWFIDDLISIAVCAEIKLREGDSTDTVSECLEGLLRVLVNLTHRDDDWASKVINNDFAVPFIIRLLAMSDLQKSLVHDTDEDNMKFRSEDQGDNEIDILDPSDQQKSTSGASPSRIFDRLCLTLGLLMNLVQSARETKDMLRQTKLSPTCTLKSASCAKRKGCTCANPMNAIQILVKIYNANESITRSATHSSTRDATSSSSSYKTKREPSPTPPPPPSTTPSPPATTGADEAHLIQGTLAILFGLLMDFSPPNQTLILSALSDANGHDGIINNKLKLARLVEQGKDFVAFYDAIHRAAAATDDDSGDVSGGDDQSANEVVEILERLRNSY